MHKLCVYGSCNELGDVSDDVSGDVFVDVSGDVLVDVSGDV